MKNQSFGRGTTCLAIVLVCAALGWADVGTLRGDTLGNCILEVRPLRPQQVGGDIMQESQVYWDEYKDTSAKHYGTSLTIEVPKDSLLILGDGDASTASMIALEAKKSYVVRAYWNNTTGHTGGFYKVSEDGGASWGSELTTRFRGSYDPLGMFTVPATENVNREDADAEKKRVRLWSMNRGVEVAMTLSDV